ncbi:MAG: cell division protein SepF [Armatimonadota bacterium]|nr:cell division protein SepF [Armatimonadota bacterium]
MSRRFTLYDEDEEMEQPGRWSRLKEWLGLGNGEYEEEEEDAPGTSTVRNTFGRPLQVQQGRQQQIHRIVIRTYKDVVHAADMLKARRPVVLNLETTEPETARRALDFACGAAYALDGSYERVGEKVFLFTPSTTLIVLDDEEVTAGPRGIYTDVE